MRKPWKSFLHNHECELFSSALDDIRDRNASVQDRLHAVARLCDIIDGAPWCEQVENALFHQCFTWPLLVSKQQEMAIALPVLVDAQLPRDQNQHEESHYPVEVSGFVSVHGVNAVVLRALAAWGEADGRERDRHRLVVAIGLLLVERGEVG